MDTDTPAGAGAGADLDRDGPGLVSSQSPFFPGSHHFTIAGGTFNSFNSALTVPSGISYFRMIPLGDIDLQREIQVEFRVDDDSGVVSQQDRRCVRRVYSANVEGSKVAKTVAIYEGDSAEGEWRRDIAFYTAFRHPHLMQVFGAASSPGIHATVFHGDLIPFEHFVNHHRNSPILTVYMFGYISAQFWVNPRRPGQ
ncbi:hypothetical protein C8R46DRAFT_1238359 [Mycena filopes]|nr:hypothetical protein C8R46DRAFT_1238359 [Mycena filopes]